MPRPALPMRTLRLHQQLYTQTAIDRAQDVYREHMTVSCVREPPYALVTIEAADPELEARLAGEFGNYVLGASIPEHRSTTRTHTSDQGIMR
jgi:hypothetical protein